MDQALESGRYNDHRSRSRSPARRGEYEERPYYEDRRPRGRGGHRGGRGRHGGGRYVGSRGGRRDRGFRPSPYGGGRFNGPASPTERNYENSIFVGNLSFDCTREDLRDYFGSIGEIISTDVIFSRGRPKGMGTVEFADHQMVEDAIRQFDNTVFMDRDIFVKQDRAPPGNNRRERSPRRDEGGRYGDEGGRYGDEGGRYGDEGGRYGESYPPPPSERSRRQQQNGYEVFVINLPYSTTWQDLKDMFREAGDVLRADIELNYKGFSRGFGNVFFATKEEMYKAIDLFNGCELDGRVLEVREGRFNYLVDEARGERSEPAESRYRDNEGPRDEPVEDVDMGPEGSEREMTQEQSLPPPQNSTFTEGIVGGGDKNNIIFCSNLPFATSSNDLYELFESFGRVEKAEFKFDPTGGPTGNAVVEYSDADTAELCISKLNNYNYGGNDLAVSYAQHDTEL